MIIKDEWYTFYTIGMESTLNDAILQFFVADRVVLQNNFNWF